MQHLRNQPQHGRSNHYGGHSCSDARVRSRIRSESRAKAREESRSAQPVRSRSRSGSGSFWSHFSGFHGAQLGCLLYFPIAFIYYEWLFRVSTVGGVFTLGMLLTVLFSCAYGFICYLLTTMFKNPTVNRFIALGLLILNAVAFLVEYFVYYAFKVFYDLNTMTNGAGDMAKDFMGETLKTVFSFNGLWKIFLFSLPTVFYAIFGRAIALPRPADRKKRLTAFVLAVLVFLTSFAGANLSYLSDKYRAEYTFQDAVSNFGVLTGLRLDISNKIIPRGANGGGFETDSHPEETKSEPEPVKPVEYGYNQMDIDFAAKAKGASSTHKELDEYVATLKASKKNEYTGLFKGKNLIMISAEAFTAEAIDPKLTPTLYRMATKGINFTDYYQPASAGTTGGEYQNIFGMLPTQGGRSFKDTIGHNMYFTMSEQLNRLGYYGKAFHNNTYTYYDRDKTHTRIGFSDGYMGYGNGMEQYVTKTWPESDLEMLQGTLPTYIDKQPFNVYYMSVSGHSGYSKSGNAMARKNWAAVENMEGSEDIKAYKACNIELDKAMEATIKMLEQKGIADDTVICISADHFPYGLDSDAALGKMPYLSELYGYNVTDMFQRDHNRLILWSGCLEKQKPIVVDTPTFSLDILPTLSNLFGLEYDSRLLVGRDVFSDAEALVFNSGYDWKTELGTYFSSKGKFVPKDDKTVIPDGYIDRMKKTVRNKMNFCADVLDSDYYAHLFGKKK